ncbi:MAG: FAD-binding oxidoreductase [Rhodocyclales bacterium]|nr:FAD-binding oxidoreductase [Rhodocyclales bacterium]
MLADRVVLDQLTLALGAARVASTPAEMAPYIEDWRGRYRGDALAVVHPGTVDEVAAVVGICAARQVSIVPQGGNTGLCGGATPLQGGRSVVVNLSRMNRIRQIDVDNNTLIAEAGCTLAAVQAAAAGVDRLFPLSLAAEGSCEIGGNLSTNAGGVHVLRYGNMRELTLGLEVVLPDGRVWNGLRALRKDNTGYDLKHLFIGAEGTLGIVTAAVLKLFPRPRARVAAWLDIPAPAAAVKLLGLLQARCGERLTAFEIIGREALNLVCKHLPNARAPFPSNPEWSVLVELSDPLEGARLEGMLEATLAAAIDSDLVRDAVLAANLAQTEALWALRENISEAQRLEGISIKHDIAVPVSRIAEFIERAGAALKARWPDTRLVVFGHIGDGNLHYNLSRPDAVSNQQFIAETGVVNRVVHDLVHQLGGSISAEHGLGQLKRQEILRYKDEVELDLMRRVKSVLDPQALMNPGKLI